MLSIVCEVQTTGSGGLTLTWKVGASGPTEAAVALKDTASQSIHPPSDAPTQLRTAGGTQVADRCAGQVDGPPECGGPDREGDAVDVATTSARPAAALNPSALRPREGKATRVMQRRLPGL